MLNAMNLYSMFFHPGKTSRLALKAVSRFYLFFKFLRLKKLPICEKKMQPPTAPMPALMEAKHWLPLLMNIASFFTVACSVVHVKCQKILQKLRFCTVKLRIR